MHFKTSQTLVGSREVTAHTLGGSPGCYRAGTQPVACGAGHRRPRSLPARWPSGTGVSELGLPSGRTWQNNESSCQAPRKSLQKEKECHRWPLEKGGGAGDDPAKDHHELLSG